MDIDKELKHIADWLRFSVDFKIDEVSEELDRKIYHKEGFFATFLGLFEEKGRDRFYNRNEIKSNHFKVYRKEIEIKEQCNYYLNRDRDYILEKIKEVISTVMPGHEEDLINPYLKQLSYNVEDYKNKMDKQLQDLFGDDMPLVLDGLIANAKYGGTTHIYRGI